MARWQPWQGPYTEASPAQVRNYLWHAEVVCELDVLTAAWNLARRRALDRLTEEALEVGADAVVGVRVHRSDHDLGAGTIEYVVTGTAIREPGGAGSDLAAAHRPLGAGLLASARRRTGAGGVGRDDRGGVRLTGADDAARAACRRTAANMELEELSTAFRSARETVRRRIESQVADARARARWVWRSARGAPRQAGARVVAGVRRPSAAGSEGGSGSRTSSPDTPTPNGAAG